MFLINVPVYVHIFIFFVSIYFTSQSLGMPLPVFGFINFILISTIQGILSPDFLFQPKFVGLSPIGVGSPLLGFWVFCGESKMPLW